MGPPLAAGLPGLRTGFRERLWGHPLRLACFPSIVGPPLAGGLPGPRTGFSYRFWGHPLPVACLAFARPERKREGMPYLPACRIMQACTATIRLSKQPVSLE